MNKYDYWAVTLATPPTPEILCRFAKAIGIPDITKFRLWHLLRSEGFPPLILRLPIPEPGKIIGNDGDYGYTYNPDTYKDGSFGEIDFGHTLQEWIDITLNQIPEAMFEEVPYE